jgi:hypothetical protein
MTNAIIDQQLERAILDAGASQLDEADLARLDLIEAAKFLGLPKRDLEGAINDKHA